MNGKSQTLDSTSIPEISGIKINGNIDSCSNKFLKKGYTFFKREDNVIVLKGKIGNDDVKLFLVSTPKTKLVWKGVIDFPEQDSWEDLKDKFGKIKGILIDKYGTPSNDFHFFKSPYYEGDGYELTAVSNGNCVYSTYWTSSSCIVSVEISSSKLISVGYENEINDQINKQENDNQLKSGL
jgi:hypothetical protein